jgi:hypothetical protein
MDCTCLVYSDPKSMLHSKNWQFSHFSLQILKCTETVVGFIYVPILSSLSSTSSILAYGSIHHLRLAQKDFNNISVSFQNLFLVVLT